MSLFQKLSSSLLPGRRNVAIRRNHRNSPFLSNDWPKHQLELEEVRSILGTRTSVLKSTDFESTRFAIYSAYFGSAEDRYYDEREHLQHPLSNMPGIFFSNSFEVLEQQQSRGWKPVHLDLEVSRNPIYSNAQGKIVKMLPHLLPELEIFDFTFWFDDKLPPPPESSTLQAVNLLEDLGLPFALSEHPEPGGNILLELQRAQRQPRYLMQNQQMIDYITYELENGGRLSRSAMYQGGLILRNMRHGRVESFNEDWYTRSQQCGIEDQLSLNFVTEEFEFAPLYRWY